MSSAHTLAPSALEPTPRRADSRTGTIRRIFPTARVLRIVPALIVCVFAASPTLLAANASKAAIKSLKKDTSTALKVFKQSAKAQRKQLAASLAVIDVKIMQGNASASDVNLVFEALKSFQAALAQSMDDTRSDLFYAFNAAKTILTDGGVADLPKGFRFGEGGIADEYRRGVMSATDAVLRDAEERVLETGKLFKKHAEVGICVRLTPPKNLAENPGNGSTSFTALQHTISILLSGRDLTGPGNGDIYLWGNCFQTDALSLSYFSSDGGDATVTPTKVGNSWQANLASMDSGYFTFKIFVTGLIGGGGYGSISVP